MTKDELADSANSLWALLEPELTAFSEKIRSKNNSVQIDIRNWPTEIFFLNGYVEFFGNSIDDELVVSTSLQITGSGILLDSDVCMNSGEIIAQGPDTRMSNEEDSRTVQRLINQWFEKFKVFLEEIEPTVTDRISKDKSES